MSDKYQVDVISKKDSRVVDQKTVEADSHEEASQKALENRDSRLFYTRSNKTD